MAKIYYRWITDGKMTVDEVPVRWRDAVCALMETAGGAAEST